MVSASALLGGITPLFGAPTRTADGFSFAISNFDPSGSYLLSSTAGTASISGSTVTVSALAPNAAATVTVTVSRAGYTDALATQSGAALSLGTAPDLRDVVATADGFTFTIANFDPALSYSTLLDPSAGVVTVVTTGVGAGTGTVSGEAPGVSVTLTVTAIDPGVSAASATVSATVLTPGTAPLVSASTSLAGGYRFTITNFDPAQSYSFVQADGGTVTRDGDTVTVSGLAAGVASDTTVTASSVGSLSASATATGSSLPTGGAIAVSAVTRTIDGFTFTITREPGTVYTVTSDAGTATISGSTVTVSGLAAGATTTASITASAVGVLDAVADVTGTAIYPGVAPTFSVPVAAAGGFVFTITNYSVAFSYSLSTSAGTITRHGDRVTVTGLAAGATALAQLTATQIGYRAASASLTGRAIAPAAAPAVPTVPVSTPQPPSVAPTPVAPPQNSIKPGDSSLLVPLRDSKAGHAAVTNGGGAMSSIVDTSKTAVKVGAAGGLSLTVAAHRNGRALPLAADGVVEARASDQLRVNVAGFAPNSVVTIWTLSGSLELAVSRTDATGETGESVLLPGSLPAGVHTLVVTGVDAQGQPVTMQMGIRVLDAQTAPIASPADGSWLIWLLAAVVLLLLVAWFAIARRRRRREDERAA
jgi:titin